MPYEWLPGSSDMQRLRLWPFRSLPKTGFAWFIGGTAALISLPLFAVLGTAVLWGLLPFLVAAIAGLWLALARSYRDGEVVEDLTLSPDMIHLVRRGPGGRRQDWQANPHWIRLTLYRNGGPVPNYVTLSGNGREVELGAFLSEDERIALHTDLAARLSRLR